MTRIEKAVNTFFEYTGLNYENPNGIEIALLTGDTVCVNGFWPKEEADENVSLVLMTMCNDYADFARAFEINDDVKGCVDRITTATLMKLYHSGRSAICCSIDGVHAPTLEFDKRDNKIIAIDELQIEHEVDQELKTPAEFVSFTKAFFENNKHLTEVLIFKNGSWQSPAEIAN